MKKVAGIVGVAAAMAFTAAQAETQVVITEEVPEETASMQAAVDKGFMPPTREVVDTVDDLSLTPKYDSELERRAFEAGAP